MNNINNTSAIHEDEYIFILSYKIIMKGMLRNKSILMLPESKKIEKIAWEQNHIIIAFESSVNPSGVLNKDRNINKQHPEIIIVAKIAKRRILVFSIPLERIAILRG